MKFFDKILNKKNSKDKIDYTKLFGVIASRSNSLNDMFNGILPNPDLVLSRQGKGIEIYNELLYDPHVMSCVQSRKTAILSLEWDIYQNSKNRNKPDIEVNNLIRNIFSKLDLNNIVCEMLDAVLFGYKPFEIIWKEENGYIIPENVVGKPPQWFFFDNSNLLKFRQKDNPSGIYLPNKKFFVVKHLANYDNPYGTALLARCFWPVTFKKGGMKLWSIYTQKYGMPFLHGKIALGKGQEEAFELFNVLEKLQQDGIAVTEEEVNIDILESAKGSSADIYKNLLHFCNAEISKAILSQTLTTEQGDTGSYAMSQTHLQVRKDVVDSDKQLVEYWLNKLIEWIIDFNFESVSEMPKFVMYEEQDVDMTLAQRDQALASTNQIKFTKEYFKRNYGFKDDEIEIAQATQPISPFSENGNKEQKSSYDITQFDELTQAVLKPVLEMIENGTSYNEIQDKIVEMFPDLETSELEDFLAKGILIATGSGFISGKR